MKKVLVVDDTKNIRNLLKTCLEIEGYDVITAVDGKRALELATFENLDLIFLDIKLPEISGTEVLRRIRAYGVSTPIIIMTAFATVKNAVECTKLGAVAYLQKPFTAEKVRALLDEMILQNSTDRSDLDSVVHLSSKLIREGRYNEAYENLKRALSKSPNDARIYELLGAVMKGLNKYEEAEKYYQASLLFRT